MPNPFEEIDHTADWALRVHGATLADLLINAARGMVSLMVDNPAALPATEELPLELSALDAESLLVEWLGELAYHAEADRLIFHQFDLHHVSPTGLRATLWGGRVPALKKHIKAVTYHNLQITATATGLETTVVFDV